MVRFNHYIGGIFLVAGTTIGAGMLALPVTTALIGYGPSIALFLICWGFMLASAFFFLDVNLAVKGEPNLISMASRTLGIWGKSVAWIFYLLLLYSLIAAYIAASAPLFVQALEYILPIQVPALVGPFILPLVFGSFVYLGTLGVDLVNRLLMIGLIVSYALLVVFLPSHIHPELLGHMDLSPALIAFPVIITSFGYHIIIPTLTTYMNHDKKHLRLTLFIGSVVALLVYVLWQTLVLGIVPLEGENGLLMAWQKGLSSAVPLAKIVTNPYVRIGAQFFSFFAIVTSFLGVSLSLSDFLTDGFKIRKSWEGRLLAILLVFIPPLFFVFTYKRGFIVALEYAGAFVAILLIFLPAMMAWQLKEHKFYRSPLGKCCLPPRHLLWFFLS